MGNVVVAARGKVVGVIPSAAIGEGLHESNIPTIVDTFISSPPWWIGGRLSFEVAEEKQPLPPPSTILTTLCWRWEDVVALDSSIGRLASYGRRRRRTTPLSLEEATDITALLHRWVEVLNTNADPRLLPPPNIILLLDFIRGRLFPL
eukprot:GFYU01027746.1.p2 GENE.GFYU01027746.1~~GFYU01027746.1.p2  ORF type:complete len:148 (+),score=3.44 GFYU01027746.1:368-811(+)